MLPPDETNLVGGSVPAPNVLASVTRGGPSGRLEWTTTKSARRDSWFWAKEKQWRTAEAPARCRVGRRAAVRASGRTGRVALSLRGKRSSATFAIEFHALRRSAASALPWRAGCSSSSNWAASGALRRAPQTPPSIEERQSRPALLVLVPSSHEHVSRDVIALRRDGVRRRPPRGDDAGRAHQDHRVGLMPTRNRSDRRSLVALQRRRQLDR